MRAIIVALLVALCTGPGASGQMSKDELLEIVDSGTEAAVIISLIERDCVDFEVDAPAVSELAGRVPRHVIQAAIDCSAPPPESFMCRTYRALTADSRLDEFPVVVRWFEDGHLRLLEVSPGTWLEERGIKGLKNRFKATREHSAGHRVALAAIKDLQGVRSYVFDSDPSLSSAEIAAMQRDAVLEECSQHASLRVVTKPLGAEIYVDEQRRGLSPANLDLLPGEHLLEIEVPNFEVYSEQFLLRDGEKRELVAELQPQGSLLIKSEPSDAVVVLDGSFAGHTPAEVFVDSGLHRVQVVQRGRPPYVADIGLGRGEQKELEVELEPPVDGYCVEVAAVGSVSKSWKQLAAELEGVQLRLRVPLYEVVSSSMEREVASTHVVDARRVLFEPGTGKQFVDSPWELLGQDLGGRSFGETAVDLLETPPGLITITGLERKKAALRLEILHESGDKNAIFLDFTRGLDFVEVPDFLAALCLVASGDLEPARLATP